MVGEPSVGGECLPRQERDRHAAQVEQCELVGRRASGPYLLSSGMASGLMGAAVAPRSLIPAPMKQNSYNCS